ncbi:MAG TPA: DNA polymerase III subunit gamma/tau [Candidatus Paceibacterota bacterium]|nr:DNA polymerase III subunit gamma/tau [Candidatus Paceibacterota bacterium]
MQHIALYRKYRPQKFSEVVGQDAVVSALTGALKSSKISHAYLFSGSRGTGKTSIARIFARDVGVSEKDIYEIDAASNRGIDDIRALRDGVSTLPFDSKYKVYIIDEVHMLTKEAFNALLKTLEEPPAHAIFILATTEKNKLPETIISRCQTFEFKRPSVEIIRTVITDAAKKEGIILEGTSSELIAISADGSFRDAYGILERVMAGSSGKKISVEEVEKATGAPKHALVNALISAVAEKKWDKAIEALHVAKEHSDMTVFAELLISKLRAALMMRIDPHADFSKTLSAEDIAFLKKLPSDGITAKTLAVFLDAYGNVARSPIAELPIELAILSLAEGK